MIVLKYIAVVIIAYLLGSFSLAISISNNIGKDIRNTGSGNAGATNMARVYGWKAGVLTLGGDMIKACIAIGIGKWLLGDWGLMAAGLACMVGHCFPIFYGFKGGKGISVGAAIGIMIDWKVFLFIVVVFAVAALASKKVSLGSVCASVGITIASVIFSVSTPKLILAVIGMILAVSRHSANIKRLIDGTEKDFKFGKSKL